MSTMRPFSQLANRAAPATRRRRRLSCPNSRPCRHPPRHRMKTNNSSNSNNKSSEPLARKPAILEPSPYRRVVCVENHRATWPAPPRLWPRTRNVRAGRFLVDAFVDVCARALFVWSAESPTLKSFIISRPSPVLILFLFQASCVVTIPWTASRRPADIKCAALSARPTCTVAVPSARPPAPLSASTGRDKTPPNYLTVV
jgi:hypothetical protein